MRILVSLFLTALSFSLFAQPKQNSPYSRYGMGDFVHQYFASQAGMGGQTTANNDPFHLNVENPASYAYLRTTAFEAGVYAKFSQYQSASAQQNLWSGNINYLAVGMPLKSPVNEVLDKKKSNWKYGFAAMLAPYSQVGYKINSTAIVPNVGKVVSDFEGTGGSYRLLVGGGAKHKTTSFGLNFGFLFGKTAYENTTSFSDSVPTYQDNFRDEYSAHGVQIGLGVQHQFVLETDLNDKEIATRWLTVGATFDFDAGLSGTANILRIRSSGRLDNGQYAYPDTLSRDLDKAVDITLPGSFSLGVMYVKANKLKLGAQFKSQRWANYSNNIRPETLRSTSEFSAGVEYIRNATAYNSYMKRIRLRAGAYFRQDPRVVNGQNVDDIGVTVGFGFPLILPRQGTSFINTSFEIGQMGSGTVIKENYVRITLGFTMNDNSWFYKRRFE